MKLTECIFLKEAVYSQFFKIHPDHCNQESVHVLLQYNQLIRGDLSNKCK